MVTVDTATVTYQEETFAQLWGDVQDLLVQHWEEIAQDKDKMPLDVDVASYQALAAAGALSCVTVRSGETLLGYFVSTVRPHLHYQSTLCAYADVYYLHPSLRGTGIGAALFAYTEAVLRGRGVQKLVASTKVYADVGALFRRLGWRETETVYTKWIGG